jgi:hypothetical protein
VGRPQRRRRVDRRLASLRRARDAAERNYRWYPHVLGVGAGRKFRKKNPTDEIHCIQFFVTRKLRNPEAIGRFLPAFVYGRKQDGSVDRRIRFPTDVIAVGRVEPACSAGSELDSETGAFGAITLVFRNRMASGAGRALMVTCAHVIGDLSEATPPDPEVESTCCRGVEPLGKAILSAVRHGHRVEYDVALIRISDAAQEHCQLDYLKTTEGVVLRAFLPADDIDPHMKVECDFPVSGTRPAQVDGFAGTVLMTIGGRECAVRNAFLIRANVRKGDSGGLVYRDDRAVGILFGRSTAGWGWFHALEETVAHLRASDPGLAFRVF